MYQASLSTCQDSQLRMKKQQFLLTQIVQYNLGLQLGVWDGPKQSHDVFEQPLIAGIEKAQNFISYIKSGTSTHARPGNELIATSVFLYDTGYLQWTAITAQIIQLVLSHTTTLMNMLFCLMRTVNFRTTEQVCKKTINNLGIFWMGKLPEEVGNVFLLQKVKGIIT